MNLGLKSKLPSRSRTRTSNKKPEPDNREKLGTRYLEEELKGQIT